MATTDLDSLPLHSVRAARGLTPDAARDWAARAAQRFVHVPLNALHGKRAVLAEIGRALDFPAHYGANLDALYDCLTDLAPEHGTLLLLDGLATAVDGETRDAVLDVFRDAAQAMPETVAWRVLWR